MITKFRIQAVFAAGLAWLSMSTASSLASSGADRAASPPPRNFSVDHPPSGALGPLIDFARCMRRHGVPMPSPTRWAGHTGRLTLYLPPLDRQTRGAYRACNHYRALAKQKGGPH